VNMATVGRAKIGATHLRLAVPSISRRGNGKVVEVRGFKQPRAATSLMVFGARSRVNVRVKSDVRVDR